MKNQKPLEKFAAEVINDILIKTFEKAYMNQRTVDSSKHNLHLVIKDLKKIFQVFSLNYEDMIVQRSLDWNSAASSVKLDNWVMLPQHFITAEELSTVDTIKENHAYALAKSSHESTKEKKEKKNEKKRPDKKLIPKSAHQALYPDKKESPISAKKENLNVQRKIIVPRPEIGIKESSALREQFQSRIEAHSKLLGTERHPKATRRKSSVLNSTNLVKS